LLVSRRIELYRPHAVSSCTVYHRQDDAASRTAWNRAVSLLPPSLRTKHRTGPT